MWRSLPLNAKIILFLVLVQASTLTVGAIWVVRWSEAKRLEELTQLLDTESDAIEGTMTVRAEGLSFDVHNEAVRELGEDGHFFYDLRDAAGRPVAESPEPDAEIKAGLKAMRPEKPTREARYVVSLPSGQWLAQSEPVIDRRGKPIGFIQVAIDAQPGLDEIARLQRSVILGALGILVVTSLGSGLVVSFSTRNLREFARRIRGVKPPFFAGGPDLAPQSAEESLLFDSFREMADTARASVAAQGLFIAHASHELKSPISAALSALEVTLSRPRSVADYEETCRSVLKEVLVLRRLSTSLLDLARLDARQEQEDERLSDGISVIRTVLARWKDSADGRGIRLSLASEDLTAVLLPGQPEQWEVVFGNLVDNAVKYGKEGGSVLVSLREAGEDQVEFLVADDGRGMPPEQVSRLGELFFRGDAARSDSSSFGLGFAHAQRVVEQLGGKIGVISREGSGTDVTVTVPGTVART